MKKNSGSTTVLVVSIAFVLIAIGLYYTLLLPPENSPLIRSLQSLEEWFTPGESSPQKTPEVGGVKIVLPNGHIGCKQDVRACPSGTLLKRTLPTCEFAPCY